MRKDQIEPIQFRVLRSQENTLSTAPGNEESLLPQLCNSQQFAASHFGCRMESGRCSDLCPVLGDEFLVHPSVPKFPPMMDPSPEEFAIRKFIPLTDNAIRIRLRAIRFRACYGYSTISSVMGTSMLSHKVDSDGRLLRTILTCMFVAAAEQSTVSHAKPLRVQT